MEIKDIIKTRRKELGLTQRQVADRVGVSEATVSRWETGNIANVKRSRIAQLAKALQISPSVIMGWEEPNTYSKIINIYPIETQKIPMLGSIACSQPVFAADSFESYVEAGANIHADFCLRCNGDSMINARIYDGDIVFIRKQPNVDNGEIAAVKPNFILKMLKYNNSTTIKKCTIK